MGDYPIHQPGETALVNIKDCPEEEWDHYIGRKNRAYDVEESPFANPYKIGDGYTRLESVKEYSAHLASEILIEPLREHQLEEMRGDTLACWCVPELCHGHVILWYFKNDEFPSKEDIENIYNSL